LRRKPIADQVAISSKSFVQKCVRRRAVLVKRAFGRSDNRARRNFPAIHSPADPKNNQGCSKADLLPRYSPNPAIRLPKGSDRSGSTSDVLHARAQLHRCMLYFFPASAESDSSDDSCENDSALHASSPKVS
jgi:hypothetical protein